ncbi:MAG: periplasmic heavy metal sensor [Bacteroidales bacterium]|nr:periplasmic heavy metal sensor [Bacteroidales bacterium]
MWINKRENILKLIIVLTIINLAALGTMFYHMYLEREPELPDSRAREIYRKELQLNPDQQMDFDLLHDQFKNQSKEVVDQIREQKFLMIQELEKEEPDTIVLNRISEDLGMLHIQLKRSTYQHFLQMKKVCKPEQRKHLNRMYRNMIERPKDDTHRRGRHRRGNRNGQKHNN